MSFALPGSEATEEGNVLQERPCSTHFSDCVSMLAYLDRHHGQDDICELFSGKALGTQIAVRRRLNTGPNFDVVCEIDLTDEVQVPALWTYLKRHRPRCIIAGPLAQHSVHG